MIDNQNKRDFHFLIETATELLIFVYVTTVIDVIYLINIGRKNNLTGRGKSLLQSMPWDKDIPFLVNSTKMLYIYMIMAHFSQLRSHI